MFAHRDHVSAIHRTFHAIWNSALHEAGPEAAGPPFFEEYGKHFGPDTGTGGLEIWIPVKT